MIALLLMACFQVEAESRDVEFAKSLTGVEFVGSFTVTGQAQENGLKSESYSIRRVEKLPQADLWRFVARIRYGETDVELPMDLPVKWAGNTAVITLDNVWLPGLGNFSSRVLIHDQKYAGTWKHDDKGGHLFGVIRPAKPESEPPPAANKPAATPATPEK